jgi:aspartokinase-like uncharacterized kinase
VSALTVVKVGGSLLDLAELGPRLCRWLDGLRDQSILIVPGGGPTADVIRDLDAQHRLGEAKSHWLALRAMALNAYVLHALLPRSILVESINYPGMLAVLDPLAFCLRDEREHPEMALAHSWSVTSDSIAARVAVAARAERLVLLKSVDIPKELSWAAAAQIGYVDAAFPGIVATVPSLEVQALNFRNHLYSPT